MFRWAGLDLNTLQRHLERITKCLRLSGCSAGQVNTNDAASSEGHALRCFPVGSSSVWNFKPGGSLLTLVGHNCHDVKFIQKLDAADNQVFALSMGRPVFARFKVGSRG